MFSPPSCSSLSGYRDYIGLYWNNGKVETTISGFQGLGFRMGLYGDSGK